MPEERTFTEAEHQALLESAVEREVAAAIVDREQRVSELEQRVDVLEAEKAAAEQAKSEAEAEFAEFKENIEQAREVEERKADRVKRVKASAPHLPEAYFSEDRIQRWAEMADDAFSALVEDFEEVAVAALSPEEAKSLEGLEGESRAAKLAELHTKREAASKGPQHRETAAFGGGKTPGDTGFASTGKSKFGEFLAASRGEKVSAE